MKNTSGTALFIVVENANLEFIFVKETLMEQILCHLIGDYWAQSDWMANNKTKSHWPAFCHVLIYTLVFLFLTTSWKALFFIGGTHFLIDRFRLARYLCWAKNWLAPLTRQENHAILVEKEGQPCIIPHPYVWIKPWSVCKATGYDPERPIWLTTWLLIITDNSMHLLCNYFALNWLN